MDLLKLAFEAPTSKALPETPRGLPNSVIRNSTTPISRTFSSDSSKSSNSPNSSSPASVGRRMLQKNKKNTTDRLGSPRLVESISPKNSPTASNSPINVDKDALMRDYKSFHEEMNNDTKNEDTFDFYSGYYEKSNTLVVDIDAKTPTNHSLEKPDNFPSLSPTNHTMIVEYAAYLGMDVERDYDLFWIAEEAYHAQLPNDWVQKTSSSGHAYYFNEETGVSQWSHPLEEHYKILYANEKYKKEHPISGSIPELHEEQDNDIVNGGNKLKDNEDIEKEGSEYFVETNEDLYSFENGSIENYTNYSYGRSTSNEIDTSSFCGNDEKILNVNSTVNESWNSLEENCQSSSQQCQFDRKYQELEKTLASMKEKYSKVKGDNLSLKKEIEANEKKIVRKERENDFIKKRLTELELEAHEKDNKLLSWDAILEQIQNHLALCTEKKKLSTENDHTEKFTTDIKTSALEVMIDDVTKTIKGFQSHLPQNMRDAAVKNGTIIGEDSSSSKIEVENLKEKLMKKEKELEFCKDQEKDTKDEIKNIKISYRKVEEQFEKLSEKYSMLEVENQSNQNELARTRENISNLKKQGANEHDTNIKTLNNMIQSLEKELDKAKSTVAQQEMHSSITKDKYENEISKLERKISSLEDSIQRKAEVEEEKINALANDYLEKEKLWQDRNTKIDDENVEKSREIESLTEEIYDLKVELSQANLDRDSFIAKYEKACQSIDMERKAFRALNDRILELQGNIRVLCRIRPTFESENTTLDYIQKTIQVPQEGSLLFHDAKFEFDSVFEPNNRTTQESIFEEVEPAIVSILNGKKVSVFAYGQTGSGKTFTMEGPENNRGVNYRAIERLFAVANMEADTYDFAFKISMLEVYNETIHDLLADKDDGESKEESKNDKGLQVRVGAKNHVYVEGLATNEVSNMAEVERLLQKGALNRHVGSTKMNEHSSRSHLVISLSMLKTSKPVLNSIDNAQDSSKSYRVVGKLNLIDLAGSERLKATGATGMRAEEGKNINKSLSALGDVINALASKHAHVPYRNSKLTFLLQDSLSINAKVVMFVNINPSPESIQESMCSLNFASRCRRVQLGKSSISQSSTTSNKSKVEESNLQQRPSTPRSTTQQEEKRKVSIPKLNFTNIEESKESIKEVKTPRKPITPRGTPRGTPRSKRLNPIEK